MLRTLGIVALFCVFFNSYAQEMNVMTFNIRYNNPGDSLNAWPYRIDKAASQIRFYGVQLLGVQEALIGQLNDLQKELPSFKYIGVGRADGKEKGEFSAIFYDTTRFQLLTGNTFWLSETPDKPGKGWDADFERIVTWGKFKDRRTGKIFFHFNTHFDHMGKIARRESAKLILKKVNEIAGKTAAIVTGDFNAKPEDEPIRIIVDSTSPNFLKDAKPLSKTPHFGPTGTFNGFQSKETSDQPIDYIFLKRNIQVLKHATLSESWQGRFSSDHFPVMAVLKF